MTKPYLDLTLEEYTTIENGESIVDVQQQNPNDVKSPPFWSLRSFRVHWADRLFANWYLATIPIGTMLFLGTVWSIFLPRAIARFGYRPPFYFGAVMGMIGAGLCIIAAWYKLYWLLIVGAGFIGGQVPCTLYYRLAAVQFSTQEFAQTAIAMVTAGGCLSALMG